MLQERLTYAIVDCKMLVKSTPGLNFINVLRTAFTHVDPECVKRYWWLDWVLMLWGATGVKAVQKMLMKLTPGYVCSTLRQNLPTS